MGQKVNPLAYRLNLRRNWQSRWYADAKKYKQYLLTDLKIRDWLMKKLANAGIAGVVIERSGNQTVVTVHVSRPGMVIGRSGSGVEELKKQLKTITESTLKLDVKEIRLPDLNAYLVGKNIATQIERRYPPKRAMNQSIDKVMRSGAKGVKILVSGRVGE